MPLVKSQSAAPARNGAARERLKQKAIILGVSLAAMWGLEIIDAILGQPLNSYGIRPRTAEGLFGILLAPVLHGDFGHLLSNTIPFAVLGFFTMLRGVPKFWMVTAFATIVGGFGVWVVGGTGTSHIGASGVIFGYFGFLLAMGIFERSFKSIALAVLVGLMYGSLIFGVVPSQPGVSWEGHLFGFLAGAAFALMTSRELRAARRKS